MQNIDLQVQSNKLVITVDMSKTYGRSASGKTVIVASTQGNQPIDGPEGVLYVGVNVYKK